MKAADNIKVVQLEAFLVSTGKEDWEKVSPAAQNDFRPPDFQHFIVMDQVALLVWQNESTVNFMTEKTLLEGNKNIS